MKAQERLNGLESKNPIRRSIRKKPSPATIKIIVLAAKEKIRVTADLWWGQEEGKTVAKKKKNKQKYKELLFLKTDSHNKFTLQPHLQQSSSRDPNYAAGSYLCNCLNAFKEV